MNKKLNISRWLMYVSVMLIVLFQLYWLRKVYQDNYQNVQREIGVVIRESFVKDQLKLIMGDSASHFFKNDTPKLVIGRPLTVFQADDSVPKRWNNKDTIRFQMKGFGNDSGRKSVPAQRFLTFETAEEDIEIKTSLIVTIPVNKVVFDSGNVVEKYGSILKDANLPYIFSIKKSDIQPTDNMRNRRQNVDNRNRQAFEVILAEMDFGNPFAFIIRKMYGQVSLSIMMTSIIIVAFSFMYKSLKGQHKAAILKDEFISNMTHELKTPVATVSVAIEALKNFSAMDNPARTKEYLDISSKELDRLSLLIDKVLRINMFEAEKLEIDLEEIDLVSLTNEVIKTTLPQAEKLNAKINWHPPAQAIKVKGDKLHLMSVAYNLLDNALKYRSENPEIEVSLHKDGTFTIMQVKDNGPGIAAEYRKKVFEKFFRVPTGNRHDVKGYGLGLSYVNEIVAKHGGTIEMLSEPQKGCNFIMKLPATG